MNTSIRSQIEAAFPFAVGKFPLSGPDGMRTPHYGLFRDDTSECIGSAVRGVYEPHTVDDVAALAEAAAGAFDTDCQVTCAWRDGHYVIVAPSREYRAAVYGNDTIWPRLVIRAGYDGQAFSGQFGTYRDACANLSLPRMVDGLAGAKIKHTSGLRDRIAELTREFARVAASWDGVVNQARALADTSVNLADFVRAVYPEPPEGASRRTRGSHDRRAEAIIRRIVRERQQLRGETVATHGPDAWMVSAWEAFQGVQGYVQHDQTRRGNLSRVDRALVALNDAAVNRAYTHALATLAA